MRVGPVYICDFFSLLRVFCDKMGIEPNWKTCRKTIAKARNCKTQYNANTYNRAFVCTWQLSQCILTFQFDRRDRTVTWWEWWCSRRQSPHSLEPRHTLVSFSLWLDTQERWDTFREKFSRIREVHLKSKRHRLIPLNTDVKAGEAKIQCGCNCYWNKKSRRLKSIWTPISGSNQNSTKWLRYQGRRLGWATLIGWTWSHEPLNGRQPWLWPNLAFLSLEQGPGLGSY